MPWDNHYLLNLSDQRAPNKYPMKTPTATAQQATQVHHHPAHHKLLIGLK